jgi:hypothetical protein
MLPSDKPRFLAILNGLAAVKPNAKLTPEACEVWWLAMHEWTFDDFRDAALHLTKSVQFMPSPYDFDQLRKAGEPTAGEAWVTVLSGAKLEPGSAIEKAARVVGGQYAIRHADIEKDLPHIQRRFMESYDAIKDAEDVRRAVPQIARDDARAVLARINTKMIA